MEVPLNASALTSPNGNKCPGTLPCTTTPSGSPTATNPRPQLVSEAVVADVRAGRLDVSTYEYINRDIDANSMGVPSVLTFSLKSKFGNSFRPLGNYQHTHFWLCNNPTAEQDPLPISRKISILVQTLQPVELHEPPRVPAVASHRSLDLYSVRHGTSNAGFVRVAAVRTDRLRRQRPQAAYQTLKDPPVRILSSGSKIGAPDSIPYQLHMPNVDRF